MSSIFKYQNNYCGDQIIHTTISKEDIEIEIYTYHNSHRTIRNNTNTDNSNEFNYLCLNMAMVKTTKAENERFRHMAT